MICTIDEFYCVRQTSPAVIIKVSENQLLATSPQICRDNQNFISGKYTCTDPISSPSAITISSISGTVQVSSFSGRANAAIFNLFYLQWATAITIILSLGLISFLLFMKRR